MPVIKYLSNKEIAEKLLSDILTDNHKDCDTACCHRHEWDFQVDEVLEVIKTAERRGMGKAIKICEDMETTGEPGVLKHRFPNGSEISFAIKESLDKLRGL